MGYKICKDCGSPLLKKGQVRKNDFDYRHASGCPSDNYEVRPVPAIDSAFCDNGEPVKPEPGVSEK